MSIAFEPGKLIKLTRTNGRAVVELTVLIPNSMGAVGVVDQFGHCWIVEVEDVPNIQAGGDITKTLSIRADGKIGTIWKGN